MSEDARFEDGDEKPLRLQALDAKTVDPRADIYSLGATLYHLLAGRPPFICEGPESMLRALEEVTDRPPPPLLQLRPDCPADVAELVHLMLEKSPDDRPQTAAEVAERLHVMRAREGEEPGDGLPPDALFETHGDW